ncbi:MAG TPA: hypothetical protein PLL41_08235 [Smithella sp.]|nr:hypothetical protein [Smithella sp.]
MPIKGMTDRDMSFPEIGKVRKGAAKQANKPGFDLKHFRVEFDEQETAAAAEFLKTYGDKPDEINIVLPFNEINRCWDAWLEAYTAGRMVARADGEYFEYLTADDGTVIVKNGRNVKTGEKHPYTEGQPVGRDTNGKPVFCKPSGRLKVVIPELQRLAFMTVLTTSVHDIVNISGQLEAIMKVNGGMLAGIPLKLRRRPKMISVPRDGKRVRMEKWLISIEADPEYVKAKLIDLKQKALPGNGLHLVEGQEVVEQLTAGDEYEYDDDEVIDGEDFDGEFEEEAEIIYPANLLHVCTNEGEPYTTLSDTRLQDIIAGIESNRGKSMKDSVRIEMEKRHDAAVEIMKIRAEAQQPALV